MKQRLCRVMLVALVGLAAAGCDEPSQETDPVATGKFLDDMAAADDASKNAALIASDARERRVADAAQERIARSAKER